MASPTLLGLVENGTIDSGIGALFVAIAEERCSFVVVAKPRLAGKSVVSDAILRFVPPGTQLHHVTEDEEAMDLLKESAGGGYLVVGEFSPARIFPNYLWGSAVRKVFEVMRSGFSLATSLHASSLDEAYSEICEKNGISDEDASSIGYLIYIERMGSNSSNFWRRVARIYEVDSVQNGKPEARLLYRWDEVQDVFHQIEKPQRLETDESKLEKRALQIQAFVDSGRTSDVEINILAGEELS